MAHNNEHAIANQTLDNQLMTSTLIKPVVIPAEILTLENANLSEKLTLALFAANPDVTEWRVRRVVGIKHDGYRKLTRRLIQKGLLTQRGGGHKVCVPGLVYKDDPEGGHFIPESKAIENGQKVALPEPSLAPPDNGIVIPSEILDLKGVGASEKCLLTVYAKYPNAQNALALRLLGTSPAGLKKMKGRLIQTGLLIREGASYRIQVPGMVFVGNPDGGYFVAEIEAIQSGQIVAPRVVKTALAILEEWKKAVDYFEEQDQMPVSTFRFLTTSSIKEIESDTLPSDPLRQKALDILRRYETIFFAFAFLFDQTPKSFWKQGKKLLNGATIEQLEAFRQKAEGLMLVGSTPRKRLELFNSAGSSANASAKS